MRDVLVILGLVVLASIPFHRLLPWLHKEAQRIQSKLEVDENTPIMFSYAGIIVALHCACTFLKGWGIVWITETYFFHDTLTAVSVCLVTLLHIWNPWLKFKPSGYLTPLLMGIFTFMSPLFGIYFLITFMVLSLLLNNLDLATTCALIVMMGIIFYTQLPLAYLPATFTLFTCSLLVASPQLFAWIEDGKKRTLLDSFLKRS